MTRSRTERIERAAGAPAARSGLREALEGETRRRVEEGEPIVDADLEQQVRAA